jgi:hypothetical protein
MSALKFETREQWLVEATNRLRNGLFRQKSAEIPQIRASVGFPGGGSARKRIGEYWHPSACTDQIPQIFISPVLDSTDQVLETLVHELVHACTPGTGHRSPFRKLAIAVGLTGKMKSTVAGPELKECLNVLSSEIGPYPHAGINLAERKKQTTRLNKAECASCGYTVRVTQKWLEIGAPLCPCNQKPMEVPIE